MVGTPEVTVVDSSLHEEEGIHDDGELEAREEGEDQDGLSATPSFTNLFESGRLCLSGLNVMMCVCVRACMCACVRVCVNVCVGLVQHCILSVSVVMYTFICLSFADTSIFILSEVSTFVSLIHTYGLCMCRVPVIYTAQESIPLSMYVFQTAKVFMWLTSLFLVILST